MFIHPSRNTKKKIHLGCDCLHNKNMEKAAFFIDGVFFCISEMLWVGFIEVSGQTKTLSISFEFSTWLCGLPDAERIWHVPLGEH
jgi:hypothetical protein